MDIKEEFKYLNEELCKVNELITFAKSEKKSYYYMFDIFFSELYNDLDKVPRPKDFKYYNYRNTEDITYIEDISKLIQNYMACIGPTIHEICNYKNKDFYCCMKYSFDDIKTAYLSQCDLIFEKAIKFEKLKNALCDKVIEIETVNKNKLYSDIQNFIIAHEHDGLFN